MVRIKFYNKVANFGDELNRYILHHLLNLPLQIVPESYDEQPHLMFIGSMIQATITTSNTVIWGAGMMDQSSRFVKRPLHIACVRGPLTRDRLIERGFLSKKTEVTLGDPALLLSQLLPNAGKSPRVYDIGFVPHYADKLVFKALYSGPVRRAWTRIQTALNPHVFPSMNAELVFDNVRATVIDVQADCRAVIEKIAQCAFIASSSLHGLIVADALGIPNTWMRLSDNLYGGSFKFVDYMRSVGRCDVEPIRPADPIDKQFIMRVLDRRAEEWLFNFDAVSYRSEFERFLKSEHFSACT